jgi:hypothetical protein
MALDVPEVTYTKQFLDLGGAHCGRRHHWLNHKSGFRVAEVSGPEQFVDPEGGIGAGPHSRSRWCGRRHEASLSGQQSTGGNEASEAEGMRAESPTVAHGGDNIADDVLADVLRELPRAEIRHHGPAVDDRDLGEGRPKDPEGLELPGFGFEQARRQLDNGPDAA